jgi:cytochrome c-type biogenesis protein CcmH/NrfF
MGSWGPKLYQDNIAEDIRDYYKDQLKRGKTNEEIIKKLIEDNEEIRY